MSRTLDNVVLALLGLVLAYAVFQWGGVLRTDQYVFLLALGALGAGCGIRNTGYVARDTGDGTRDFRSSVADWRLHPDSLLLVACCLAYILLQTIPLPVGVLRVVSPARAAALAALGPVGVHPRFAALSVAPIATFRQFLLVCGYATVFLLVRTLAGREAGRWRVAAPIIVIAAAEAALGVWQSVGLGLYQNFGGPGEQSQFGTFVNHNHYACFLEMALPFAALWPLARLTGNGIRDAEHRKRETGLGKGERRGHGATIFDFRLPIGDCTSLVSWVPESRIPYPVARPAAQRRLRGRIPNPVAACGVWALAVLMLVGIIYSLSRMGFVATLGALAAMAALGWGRRPLGWVARSRLRRWTAAAVLGAAVLAGAILLPPGKLVLRFAQIASLQGFTGEGRVQLWAETLPLIRAYPMFGCGLGGYETAFYPFKASAPMVADDFAHNDYLQGLAELGAVGFLLVAALGYSAIRPAVSAALRAADRESRCLALGCCGAWTAILLHSLADFNLYIPANAMLLAWIAGVSAAQRAQR